MSTPLNDNTVQTHSVVDARSFISALFPDKLIFRGGPSDTLESAWDSFVAQHPLAWDQFLNTLSERNSETQVQIFLNHLIQTAQKGPARLWSSANKDKAAGGDVARKPDIICYDPLKENATAWSHFVSVGELKCGTFDGVHQLLSERSATLFRNQDSRRFVLTFVLVKQFMTVALFDRGGSIISEPFSICDYREVFLRFILGISYAPLTALGYDSTVATYPMGRTISSKYIPNIHLLCTLYVAERIHGRGSVVWLAKLKGPATEFPNFIRTHFGQTWEIDPAIIVKDIWTDESSSLTEGMILALLKMKGVQGVPRVLAEERVLSEPHDHEIPPDVFANEGKPQPIPASARPDSTTLIRSRLKMFSLELWPAALKSAQQPPRSVVDGFDERAHIRSYTTPWAIPLFHFRSGVELLGVLVDTLTAHEQATSSYSVGKPPTYFPFRILHRDPSVLNMGMVPAQQSDFPPCPHRTNGEHRGLLYDWGFAKIAEVREYDWEQVPTDEGDTDMEEDVPASSDTELEPRSFIRIPSEDRTDSGLYTATPEIIENFEMLVKLVRLCIREEQPALEVTGTRPFMAIELLVASFLHNSKKHPWWESYQNLKHEVRHDLEAFYMVLVSLCLLFERPHTPKGLSDCIKPGVSLLPEVEVLPLCAVLWLTGQDELVLVNIRLRFLALCTSQGFATVIKPYLSDYFAPMAPYLERIRADLYGESVWSSGPYKHPDTRPTYDTFRTILFDAMKTIPSTINNQFSKIVEPYNTKYCPISPEGQWQGKQWSWDKSFPMRSNNAFGFFQEELPPSSVSTFKVLDNTVEPPVSYSASSATTVQRQGPYASVCYPVLPEISRPLTQRIKNMKESTKHRLLNKPYRVHSPHTMSRRRAKWEGRIQPGKGKEKEEV